MADTLFNTVNGFIIIILPEAVGGGNGPQVRA